MIVTIKVDTGIYLNVRGSYYKSEEQNNLSEQFEIEEFFLATGDLYDYSEWVAANHMSYLDKIEELVLKKINS